METLSIANKLESTIKSKGRGKIHFSSDFATLGSPEAIKKTLQRLTKAEVLVRMAHGIYLYPKVDTKYGLGILYPSMEDVAKEIAKRDHARIVPSGTYALNKLGLSTQVQMNVVYLTDGSSRKINIGNKKGILFKHTSPKNLGYTSDLLMLTVSALREIGEGKLTPDQYRKIQTILLEKEDPKNILKNLDLAPAWIRKIIIKMMQ